MLWGYVQEGENMQRKALWRSLARRRADVGTALLLAALASLSFPNALKAQGRDFDVNGPKEDPSVDTRDLADDPDPYAGWMDVTDEDDEGAASWDGLDSSDSEPEMAAASGVGGGDACAITIVTTVGTQAVANQTAAKIDVTTAALSGCPVVGAFVVDFGDGSKRSYAASAPATLSPCSPTELHIEHMYVQHGPYSVTVNVIGSVQGVTGCRAATFYGLHTSLLVNAAALPGQNVWSSYVPSIQASPSDRVKVGETMTFTALSGMPASEESKYSLYYRWTFTDGFESNAKTVTRSFAAPVTGTAELQVFAYAGLAWKQLGGDGKTARLPFDVKQGMGVVGYVPKATGFIRDLALSHYQDSGGVDHEVVWSISKSNVSIVNVDNPRAPSLYGNATQIVRIPFVGAPQPSATSLIAVAATGRFLVISDAMYGTMLFDATTALKSTGVLTPIAQIDRRTAVDLYFDEAGEILFWLGSSSLEARKVSDWSAPPLATYSDQAMFSGVRASGKYLYVGLGRPLGLEVLEFGDLDPRKAGMEFALRYKELGNQTLKGGPLAPPRDFSISGSSLWVSESWLSPSAPGYVAVYDLTHPDKPVLQSRLGGDNFLGAAAPGRDGGSVAYAATTGVVAELTRTQVPGALPSTSSSFTLDMTESVELPKNGTAYGTASKVLADPRSDRRVFVGTSTSALVVLEAD